MSTHTADLPDGEVKLTDFDPRVDAEIEWSDHAKNRWRERGSDVGFLRAWSQSEEIDYPSAHSGCRGRYHEASDSVLIVKRLRRRDNAMGWQFVDIVTSVIEVSDREGQTVVVDGRERDEAAYVRGQV